MVTKNVITKDMVKRLKKLEDPYRGKEILIRLWGITKDQKQKIMKFTELVIKDEVL